MIKLFDVANSDFPNYVRYFAIKDGENVKVDCKWIFHANDEPYRDLNWAENKFAYGFKVSTKNKETILEVSSIKTIPITLRVDGEKVIPLIRVEGRVVRIEKAFVQTKKGLFGLPGVEYVEVNAVDDSNQDQISFRIR